MSVMMRTTIRLPEDLLRRAKRKAAANGSTLTALIEQGLRSVVDEREKPAKRRVRVRVSRAAGGLNPALEEIPPGKLAAYFDELDDLEYMKRWGFLK